MGGRRPRQGRLPTQQAQCGCRDGVIVSKDFKSWKKPVQSPLSGSGEGLGGKPPTRALWGGRRGCPSGSLPLRPFGKGMRERTKFSEWGKELSASLVGAGRGWELGRGRREPSPAQGPAALSGWSGAVAQVPAVQDWLL